MFNAPSGVPEGLSSEYASALIKAAPPVTVSAAAIGGIPLNVWVLVLTLIYLALQIIYIIYRMQRDVRRGRGSDDGE